MRTIMTMLLLPLLAVLALYAWRAAGHDGRHDDWFRSLMRPDGTGSCCNLTDCTPTEARVRGGWEALTPIGSWVAIPETAIVRGRGNPTGQAVLCWLPQRGVICFVEPIAA